MTFSTAVFQIVSWMPIASDARSSTWISNLAEARTRSNERDDKKPQCES